MAYTIRVDRDKCQGIGACVGIAPEVFDLDGEGKVFVVNAAGGDDDLILEAAESCPLEAIRIFDESGEQIYP